MKKMHHLAIFMAAILFFNAVDLNYYYALYDNIKKNNDWAGVIIMNKKQMNHWKFSGKHILSTMRTNEASGYLLSLARRKPAMCSNSKAHSTLIRTLL